MVSAKLIQKAGGSFDLGNAQVHYERWASALFFLQVSITHSFIISLKFRRRKKFMFARLISREFSRLILND